MVQMTKWTSFLHRLGFHHWEGVWIMGNVWTECNVCGARRMLSFADASEIPPDVVAKFPVRVP